MAGEGLNYNATENAITWLHSNINVASGALQQCAAAVVGLRSFGLNYANVDASSEEVSSSEQ